ncbi:MAG TPA: SRPBCC domain-containing protein [Gaiellaceae bacterium]|nr:SRPBCC domain-containing protein [Gaiellaceae bacterium]
MTVTATETIRKEIYVDASPETAFRVFTEQIADWWPLQKYGLFLEQTAGVAFEDRDGWKLIETSKDGRSSVWGEVLAYEFASRLRLTWHPGKNVEEMPTEVELTFSADGNGTTVVLEHRGWEQMPEETRGARSGYDAGWDEVLARYRAAS